ncbi:MAG: hypothetical protein EZS28_020493, partial [Streblomastix strix]
RPDVSQEFGYKEIVVATELTNTHPSNFLWEQDRATLGIVQPGLYEISLGIYGKHRQSAQLLVNGETVLVAFANRPSSPSRSQAPAPFQSSHSPTSGGLSGVAGTTLLDFIALPPNARLSISYGEGMEGAEGFIALRKIC